MSTKSNKKRFWNKGFVISFISLIISALIAILFLINSLFFSIQWVDNVYDLIIPWFSSFFNDYNLLFYGGGLISFIILLVLFVLGYNIAKVKHLTGTIIYVFSLFGFVIITSILVYYAYFGILFNHYLVLYIRLMLFLVLLPVVFALSLILYPLNLDYFIFLKDLIKARKIWKHKRPNFQIEIKGNMTYINIETDEFIFSPVPILIIAKYLQTKGYSVAWYVKGAFNHLLTLIVTNLIGWPRARNKLFRFIGMKIGKNCHISQKTIPDPLLPELIEFEDGSGCGIGVKLLTHNAMSTKNHQSFSFGQIKICENARIGAYSIVMPGVTIGRDSTIGAGSLVVNDIPPYSIASGVPAKVIKKIIDKDEI